MYTYNKDFFQEINTEEKAYWLGFIAADGNVRKDFLKMRIELNIQDIEHLERFKKDIGANVPIKESIRTNNHSCFIDINCKKLCLDLNKLGITPNKSLTLQVNYSLIPTELYSHFIRGYYDGDGSLSVYEGRGYQEWDLNFIGTLHTLEFIQKEFSSNKKISSCGNNFRFCFKNKNDIEQKINILYKNATVYLKRKYEKAVLFRSQRLPSDNLLG